MKLTIDRDYLKAALAVVRPGVDQRNLPILTGVRIDPDPATLTTTNLDLAITTRLEADGAGDPVVVPHQWFAALVASCPAGPVELVAEAEAGADEVLTISAGRVVAHLRLLDVNEWPNLPAVAGEPHRISEGDWAGISAVQHARSSEVSRPVLTVCEVAGGSATCTDSYRLATRSAIDPTLDVLLPGALIDAVNSTGETSPSIAVDGRWLHVTAGPTTWSAVAPDLGFPKWANLLPVDPPISFTADRLELLEAASAAAAIGIDASVAEGGVILDVRADPADGNLTITGRHRELGDVEATVTAEVDAPQVLLVAFNSTYLIQALRSLAMSSVRFDGVDGLKPWVASEAAVRLLLMPVRVSR